MTNQTMTDPKLELVFERKTDLPVEKAWKGWTHPETLMKWFCPRPWKVTECRIDLRAGGEFYTLMEGPKGERMPNHGCFLEVVDQKKLVWTNMMTAGFQPASVGVLGFPFAATISFTKTPDGKTLYRAVVKHADEEGRRKHEAMGFQEGWGAAFNQLVELT